MKKRTIREKNRFSKARFKKFAQKQEIDRFIYMEPLVLIPCFSGFVASETALLVSFKSPVTQLQNQWSTIIFGWMGQKLWPIIQKCPFSNKLRQIKVKMGGSYHKSLIFSASVLV